MSGSFFDFNEIIPIDSLEQRQKRNAALMEAMSERILVLDGAMGSMIQGFPLEQKDFGGLDQEGCNELLVSTRPDIISSIHHEYLKAGADIIETNTFGGTPLVLEEFRVGHQAYGLNYEAAKLARVCSDHYSDSVMRFVAGSVGPTTKALSLTGGVSFDDLISHFYVQIAGLVDGGVDYILLETCQDMRNVKAALIACDTYFDKYRFKKIPVAVSLTIEPTGTMLAGQNVEAAICSLEHKNLFYLGLNCSTGPQFMTDSIRALSQNSPFAVSCVPNAGLPDEYGRYQESPEMMMSVFKRFTEANWVQVIGGCCGTTPKHIEHFKKMIGAAAAKKEKPMVRSTLSGLDVLEISDDGRPWIVGERTNVIGSSKFKALIVENKFDEAVEVARAQVKKGAHLIDVCLANPDRDEVFDMEKFISILVKRIKVPIMIDSTDAKVLELALKYSQGKSIINSINLEDGEERFELVVPLAKKYGAALVVGTIDEDPVQGMGVTAHRKLEIAKREFDLLTGKYGIRATDIYWDPLVFPVGTGDAQYRGSAKHTIDSLSELKKQFPGTKTVLGVSNISFGLPNSGREVLNAVFLQHAVKAGLDLAIVNSEKLMRFTQISDEERKLSEDLLFDRTETAIQAFADFFRKAKKKKTDVVTASLSLMDRLPLYVVEGAREGLTRDLDEALTTMKPLEIINGPLMRGMDRVGKLFNENKLIVAEVLQSAEVMKLAVSHLEPFMEKNESSVRGKMILATVKGDVHDIGKNLVDIILSNNGFQVINLGIKVSPLELIAAVKQHKPDMIGLSGLLVKSAQQMVITAEDLKQNGVSVPILVGGAALTENFVDKQIAKAYGNGTVAYANDAMNGLELAKTIVDGEKHEQLRARLQEKRNRLSLTPDAPKTAADVQMTTQRFVAASENIPRISNWNVSVLKNSPSVQTLYPFINPMMLLGRHLGIPGDQIKKNAKELSESKIPNGLDPRFIEIIEKVFEVKSNYQNRPELMPSGVWAMFKSYRRENTLCMFDENNKGWVDFEFSRRLVTPFYCLADFVSDSPGANDSTAAFVVSVGKGVRAEAEKLKLAGRFLESHVLQALALELAEGYAEFLHSEIRKTWGFEDASSMTMLERFQAKYRGKRYSFGYPACPDLSMQKKLFALLEPSNIEVELTEGDMMDPEASVSALVFHHPAACYFSLGTGGV